MKYADKSGISSNFPSRWLEDTTLDDEDNK
jgi:hypothetical protein